MDYLAGLQMKLFTEDIIAYVHSAIPSRPIKRRDIQGPDRIYNRKTALLKKNVTKANIDETWRENGVDREQ